MIKTGSLAACAMLATGATISLQDPPTVALAMQDAGYRAQLATRTGRGPVIVSGTGGAVFEMAFHACAADGTQCEGLLFVAAYDVAPEFDPAALDDWNRTVLVGRGYSDEAGRSAVVEHYVVAPDGLTERTFFDTLRTWEDVMASFEDVVGYD